MENLINRIGLKMVVKLLLLTAVYSFTAWRILITPSQAGAQWDKMTWLFVLIVFETLVFAYFFGWGSHGKSIGRGMTEEEYREYIAIKDFQQ